MPRKGTGPRLAEGDAGNYEIRWTENGRSKRASTWTKNLAEAQAALAEFLGGDRRQAKGEHAVVDIIDAYLTGHVAEKVGDKARVKNGLKPIAAFFGNRDVSGLGPDDCNAYEAARLAGKIKGFRRPAKPGTIRFELTALQTAINNAVRNRVLTKKETPILTRPAPPPAQSTWVRPEDYKNKLMPVIPITTKGRRPRLTRIYRFVVIAFNTAQRRYAIETLRWEQVDFQLGLIDFNEPGRPITKKRRPIVPMNEDLCTVLKRAFSERNGALYVLDTPGSIGSTFDVYRKKAEMPWLTRHTIRRTWATWAAIRGVSMTDIAGVLGDDVRTVERHYLKFSPGYLRRAVANPVPEALDEYLPG